MVILKLVENNLKRFYAEKNAVFIYIILPVIILSLLISSMGGGKAGMYVLIADEDNSLLSQKYVGHLKDNEQIKLKEITITSDKTDDKNNKYTKADLEKSLKDLKIGAYIVVEKGFETNFYKDQAPTVTIYGLNESGTLRTINQITNSYFSNLKGLYIGSSKDKDSFNELIEAYENKTVKISSTYTTDVDNSKSGAISFALGILIYFILLASFKLTNLAIEDKTSRVYHRIFTMPVKAADYILSYIISTFLLVLIQIGLSLAAIKLLYKGYIPFADLIAVLSIFSICATSISLLVIAIVTKKSTIEILTQGFVMFTSMLAGIFWPVEVMPSFMQSVAKVFPQYWAVDAIKALFHGESIMSKRNNLIILIIFGLLFFFLSGYFIRKNDDLRDAN